MIKVKLDLMQIDYMFSYSNFKLKGYVIVYFCQNDPNLNKENCVLLQQNMTMFESSKV